jgi:hypothetical protein
MVLTAFLASLLLTAPVQEPPTEEQEVVEEETSEQSSEEASQQTSDSEEKPLPSPEEAVEMLKEAYKGEDIEALETVLKTAGMVADKDVVKELAKGVKHKVQGFRVATLMTLRWNEDPYALEALLKLKRQKKLWEDAGTGEAYAMALGQKGGEDAAEVLGDIVKTQNVDFKVTRAAIRALGRCRYPVAAESVMDYVKGAPRRARDHMDEVRVSMGVLLGIDAGPKPGKWIDWWENEGENMAIPEKPFEIPQERVRLQWEDLWKSPAEREAERKALEERLKQKQDAAERLREGEPDA